jgi:hypothetical protein
MRSVWAFNKAWCKVLRACTQLAFMIFKAMKKDIATRETFQGIFDSNGIIYQNTSHYFSFIDDLMFLRHLGFYPFFRLYAWLKAFMGKFTKYLEKIL